MRRIPRLGALMVVLLVGLLSAAPAIGRPGGMLGAGGPVFGADRAAGSGGAGPRVGGSAGAESATQSAPAQVGAGFSARKAQLISRVQEFESNRNSIFAQTTGMLGERISLVSGIADRAAAAGLDVSQARSELAQASELLAKAQANEPLAMAALTNGVSAASGPGDVLSAIQQARSYQVPLTMQQAREAVRSAAVDLRQVISARRAQQGQDATSH